MAIFSVEVMLPPKPLTTSVKTFLLPRMKSAGAAVRLGMLWTPAAVIAIELMSAAMVDFITQLALARCWALRA